MTFIFIYYDYRPYGGEYKLHASRFGSKKDYFTTIKRWNASYARPYHWVPVLPSCVIRLMGKDVLERVMSGVDVAWTGPIPPKL